jgi:DNA replication protein DnaC
MTEISSIEARAAANIKVNEGDYLENGLWHCGKCRTAKQGRYDMPWGVVTPMMLCKCAEEERAKEEAKRKQIEFQDTVKRLRQTAFLEAEMQNWNFEHDNGMSGQVISVARNYVDNFDKMRKDGKGLLIFGTVGNGKSYAAACIVNALIDKGFPCIMTNFAEIRKAAQASFDGAKRLSDMFSQCALLVIDDLATESDTAYMQEMVYSIIDSRYRAKLPIIITTNLTSSEIKHPADLFHQRIFSRLLEMCVPYENKGEDIRRKILKQSFNEYSELLGI